MEPRVRGLCETIEGHLDTGNARLANRAIESIKAAASSPCCSAVKALDGTILAEDSCQGTTTWLI